MLGISGVISCEGDDDIVPVPELQEPSYWRFLEGTGYDGRSFDRVTALAVLSRKY